MLFYWRSVPKTNALLTSRICSGSVLDVGGMAMPCRAEALAGNGCAVTILDINAPGQALPAGIGLLLKPVETLDENDGLFDHILLSNILEHLEDPALALRLCAARLRDGGNIHILSPNCESLNRRIGLKMGIISTIRELNPNDAAVGHLQSFTTRDMRDLVAGAGLDTLECFGTQFKPIPTPELMQWPERRVEAFLDIAPEMPVELCHEFYLRAEKAR